MVLPDTLRFLLVSCAYLLPFTQTRLRLRQCVRWQQLARNSRRNLRLPSVQLCFLLRQFVNCCTFLYCGPPYILHNFCSPLIMCINCQAFITALSNLDTFTITLVSYTNKFSVTVLRPAVEAVPEFRSRWS